LIASLTEISTRNFSFHPNYLFVQEFLSEKYWYAQNPQLIKTVCQHFRGTFSFGVCSPTLFLFSLIQTKFDVSLTWDAKLKKRSAGSVLISSSMGYVSIRDTLQFVRGLHVVDEKSIKLVYCLSKPSSFLFTLSALNSLFQRYLWLITFSLFVFLPVSVYSLLRRKN